MHYLAETNLSRPSPQLMRSLWLASDLTEQLHCEGLRRSTHGQSRLKNVEALAGSARLQQGRIQVAK